MFCYFTFTKVASRMFAQVTPKRTSMGNRRKPQKKGVTNFINICPTAVREITKSSSTFSATNTISNIVWFLQLHDTIQMKSNYAWINYNHDNIAIRSHIVIYNFVWNFILVPNLVAYILRKGKNVWFFDSHLLTCSVGKMVLLCLMQNIDIYLLYKSHQIVRLVSHLINHFSKWMFTV